MLQTGCASCDPGGHGGEAAYNGKLGCLSMLHIGWGCEATLHKSPADSGIIRTLCFGKSS